MLKRIDLSRDYEKHKEEYKEAIEIVCKETAFSGGKFADKFDEEFAAYCQVPYAAGVNNGTSALHCAMVALGIGVGDEVIVPANTYIATAWGVTYSGAIPVFVDCTSDTWQIDPDKIEEKITEKTKAILGVHLYGQPFEFKKVKEITPIYHIEYYESTDEDEMLFATLKEDDSYTFFFDEEKREWVFSGLRLRDIIRPLERIDENLMAWLTLGKFADELYESMFGLRIYKEKERGVNPIEDLVNSLVEFAKDHYIVGFNDSTIKHLSAKDLEEAYHSGFYELIEKYYNDINSNDKYTFIKIEQKEDDYIVHLNDELFKDIEPNE